MRDLMLDIETLGTGKNACVVQIGACYFDRATGVIGATFCENIDLDEAMKYGEVEASTLKFWFEQPSETIKSVMMGSKSMEYVLNEFALFITNADYIWSHATFDFVAMTNLYKKVGQKGSPLHYRSARDIRTLVDLARVQYKKNERVGNHHNALDDCKFQVTYCVECFQKLGLV